MGMIGAILGDIAGSLIEFEKRVDDWDTREFFQKNSVFTDDTVQNIAIKSAVLSGTDYRDALLSWCRKYLYVGYGGNFHKFLDHPETYENLSYGNGAAMRVSYIGEHFHTLSKVEAEAEKSAKATHDSPEAIRGAKAIAGCVFLAEHGESKESILHYAKHYYPASSCPYAVDVPLCDYRDHYQFEVRCDLSVPVAIRCFIESKDYQSFLRKVYYINGDSDTIGAMGGGIAASFYHTTGLPEQELLKKYLDLTLYEWVFQ